MENSNHLKMCLLLEMVMFQCHVSFQGVYLSIILCFSFLHHIIWPAGFFSINSPTKTAHQNAPIPTKNCSSIFLWGSGATRTPSTKRQGLRCGFLSCLYPAMMITWLMVGWGWGGCEIFASKNPWKRWVSERWAESIYSYGDIQRYPYWQQRNGSEMVFAMRFVFDLAEETLVLLLPNILDIDIFMALASTRSVHRWGKDIFVDFGADLGREEKGMVDCSLCLVFYCYLSLSGNLPASKKSKANFFFRYGPSQGAIVTNEGLGLGISRTY